MKTRLAKISLVPAAPLLALFLNVACQGPSSQSLTVDAGADVTAVMHACRAYAAQNDGHFPPSLDALVERDSTGAAYLEGASVPLRDSWGTPYRYERMEDGFACELVSLGGDKRGGGVGGAQDLKFKLTSTR